MATIHPMSVSTPLPDLELFGIPPTQASIERDFLVEYKPLNPLSTHSTKRIEYEIRTSEDEYLRLDEIELNLLIRCILYKYENGLSIDITDEWSEVSPVNNLLHSMIKTIQVY